MTDFIIIGNMNAITYKEIFSYIMANKMWLGYHHNATYAFETPYTNNQEGNKKVLEGMGLDPAKHILVKGISWFTNLEHNKRKEFIGLTKKYNPTDYPKYDNFDAIEVSKVTDIPKDYDGVMGVPITYLGKHNPNQFKIIGCTERWSELRTKKYTLDEYDDANDMNATWVVMTDDGFNKGYKRLLIRKVKDKEEEL